MAAYGDDYIGTVSEVYNAEDIGSFSYNEEGKLVVGKADSSENVIVNAASGGLYNTVTRNKESGKQKNNHTSTRRKMDRNA